MHQIRHHARPYRPEPFTNTLNLGFSGSMKSMASLSAMGKGYSPHGAGNAHPEMNKGTNVRKPGNCCQCDIVDCFIPNEGKLQR